MIIGNISRAVRLLCLSAGIVLVLFAFSSQTKAAMDDAGAITGVVSAFYDKYLKLDWTDEFEFEPWLQQQPEVDAALVEKIKNLFEEAEREVGFLEYDPILMAQDIPEGMEYATPVIDGARAELIAYTLWGEDSKAAIRVLLMKREDAWRIVDIDSAD